MPERRTYPAGRSSGRVIVRPRRSLADRNFSVSGTSLSDLVIGSGTLSGLIVAQALAEAESYMGGCGSSYNKGQLINAISSINENFVDGLGDNGFLTCP
jgi:hypothetical protein